MYPFARLAPKLLKLLWMKSCYTWLSLVFLYWCHQTFHLLCSWQLVFEAVRGSSFRADIALDDIRFKESPCCKSIFSYAKLIVHRAVLLFIFLNFVRTNSQSSKQLPVQIHEQSPIVIAPSEIVLAPSASVCDELTSFFFFLPATLRSRMFIEKLKTLPADLFS